MEGIIPCCSICLISLCALDEPTRLRNCGHAYHKDCVRSWLHKTPQCPECRKPAGESDLQKDFVLITISDQLKALGFVDGVPPPSLTASTISSISAALGGQREVPSSDITTSSQPNTTVHNINVTSNTYITNANTTSALSFSNNIVKRCPAYHVHPLTIVPNPKTIYPPHGQWFCDICGAGSTLTSQMHHCMECGSFDMCANCFTRGSTTTVLSSSRHAHTLTLCDPNVIYAQFRGKWHCNLCRKNNQPEMYHCFPCKDFDICGSCANR
jgi:hypothetical protein